MRKKTLVLNGAYYPINVIGWKEAMAHYFDPDTTVLSFYNDESVKSVSTSFAIPAVIVVNNTNFKNRVMKFSAKKLFIRDQHLCSYCGKRLPSDKLNIDHIIPRSHGGITSWLNCASSCFPCNFKKKNRTPEQAGMPLLITPSIPKYDYEYFLKWNGMVYEEWIPYLPEKKNRIMVEEIIPELKFGRKPVRGVK